MNLSDLGALAAMPSVVFRKPWKDLGDQALLEHLRSPREVHFDLVVDAEECTPEKITALLQGKFQFNEETHTLTEPISWRDNPSKDVEWHILLHKFYYAAGLGQAFLATGDQTYVKHWMRLIDSWINEVPVGFIAADVTGRRVQNWIYSTRAFLSHDARYRADLNASFVRKMLTSICEQVDFLCCNLTAKRNHRTLELYAIFLAGVAFPEMEQAAYWRELALRETVLNMQADLQADGVHCEQSSDYHHLAVRNWLHVRTLAARNDVEIPEKMDALLEQALEFSMYLHQPNGMVPSLSDGDVRSFVPLLKQGAQLFGRDDMLFVATQGKEGQPPSRQHIHFLASGYHVLRSPWLAAPHFSSAQHLVFDCGPLGEGNHGHFDALSFELFAHGHALIVDPGRYTYSEAGDKNWRVHFRSTAAHNTVCVDGRSQTAYTPKSVKEPSRHAQGAIRHKISGAPPDTKLIESSFSGTHGVVHGRCMSHEYDAVHERCIVFVDQRFWIVSDWMRSPSIHDYVLNFQMSVEAQASTRLTLVNGVQVSSPGLLMAQPLRKDQIVEISEGWVSARYGVKLEAPSFKTRVRADKTDFDTVLLPTSSKDETLHVSEREVLSDQHLSKQAIVITLSLNREAQVWGWFHSHEADAQYWRVGAYQFYGRWLLWQETSDGQIARAFSHVGAFLNDSKDPITLLTGSSI
jgi:Heparinase II/III N-terminus/Heparinase II/III-like protein